MAEAQRVFAILDDVDEGTVRRFIEWAYKGYYTAARFRQVLEQAPERILPEEGEVEEPKKEFNGIPVDDAFNLEEVMEIAPTPFLEPTTVHVQNDLQEWAASSRPKFDKKTQGAFSYTYKSIEDKHDATKKRRELKGSFLKYDYKVRRDTITLPPTRGNRGSSEDYTDVFLSHARLYVFAEMYDIQILKTLALEELHSTLANYTLYQSRTGDVIDLL